VNPESSRTFGPVIWLRILSLLIEITMHLRHITITGADDNVDPGMLISLSKKFPQVEWGILFSSKRSGTPRYPSASWTEKFIKLANKNSDTKISLHLCGEIVKELIAGNPESIDLLIRKVLDYYERRIRVQINYNSQGELARTLQLSRWFQSHPNIDFILQYNKSNRAFCGDFALRVPDMTRRISMLYDASGGRGTETKIFAPPFARYLTGYAGGLSPDNLQKNLQQIKSVAEGYVIWIDTESGVRDENDNMDMEKVREYLTIATNFK
jgi:phosphoribosylanthranilate isomerase